MGEPPQLVFLLVHGIGPQDPGLHEEFLAGVEDAVADELDSDEQALLDGLETARAEWSNLFQEESDTWLETLYPKEKREALKKGLWKKAAGYYFAPLIAVTLFALGLEVMLGTDLWLRITIASAVGALLGGFSLFVIWWYLVAPRLPWGDVWNAAREFEATSVSDVILYQSPGPREQILWQVIEELEEYIKPLRDENGEVEENSLPVLMAGHSQGSVIVFDTLLGSTAESRGIRSRLENELDQLREQSETGDLSGAQQRRMDFLERAIEVAKCIRPVGMATFGSPIALFLFRKPALTKRKDLWRFACPEEFRERESSELSWRWQNFWHAADFVAHKLEPVFNEGYTEGKFVEDVRIECPVREPLSAHSVYWDEEIMIDPIGRQTAESLRELGQGLTT